MRGILKSTRAFEAWMKARRMCPGKLLKKKHSRMDEGALPFLRATSIGGLSDGQSNCPQLAKRVGTCCWPWVNLHVEDFGVWRTRATGLYGESTIFDEHANFPLQRPDTACH
jgi:hypothetical protein